MAPTYLHNLSSLVLSRISSRVVLVLSPVIIEKLLRVTEVGQIYLLIRTKKGKDAFARIEDLFNDPVSGPWTTIIDLFPY